MRLSDKPPGTSDVIVSLNSSLVKGVVSFSPTELKFEGSDGGAWDVSQTVTMTVALDGGFAYGNRNVIVTAIASSTNSVYQKVTATVPTVTVRDVDTVGVTIVPNKLQLTEAGNSAQFTVKLDSRPTSPVTITVTKDAPSSGLSPELKKLNVSLTESLDVTPAALTFDASASAWQTARAITVLYGSDGHVTDNFNRRLSFTVAGADTTGYNALALNGAVTLSVTDVDAAGVTVSSTALTVVEDNEATYEFSLASDPFFDVTITPTPSPGSPLVLAQTEGLVFATRAGIVQTVSVPRDYKQTGDRTYTITHSIASADPSYGGGKIGAIPSVTVTVTDPDVAALQVQGSDGFARTQITVEEGGAAQMLAVKLATAPLDDVVVHVVEVQEDGVTPAATPIVLVNGGNSTIVRTFAEGALPPSNKEGSTLPLDINVTRVNNDDVDGLQTTRIRFSIESNDTFYAALAPIVVAVTVRDDEAAAVEKPIAADATEVAEIKDGNVAVSIPPGALTESKTISVQQLPTTKLQALPSTETFETKTLVVQYGPPGTTFAAPVTITVPLDGGEYCLDATKHCQFLYRPGNDASDGDWAITPGGTFETVSDPSAPGGSVTVARLNVTHFSLYTVAAIKPGGDVYSPSPPPFVTV